MNTVKSEHHDVATVQANIALRLSPSLSKQLLNIALLLESC